MLMEHKREYSMARGNERKREGEGERERGREGEVCKADEFSSPPSLLLLLCHPVISLRDMGVGYGGCNCFVCIKAWMVLCHKGTLVPWQACI